MPPHSSLLRPGFLVLLLAFAHPVLSQAKDDFLEAPPRYAMEERNAYLLSAAGTLLPVGAGLLLATGGLETLIPGAILGIGGLTIGPSVGQFLAGSSGTGFTGILIRGAGAVMTVSGIGKVTGEIMCESDEYRPDGCGVDKGGGYLWISLGATTYVAGTVLSILDTHQAFQRKRKARLASMRLSPILALDRQGQARSGAVLSMRF